MPNYFCRACGYVLERETWLGKSNDPDEPTGARYDEPEGDPR